MTAAAKETAEIELKLGQRERAKFTEPKMMIQ